MSLQPQELVLRVIYSGRVQGVGFRATTAAIARKQPVSGYVMNCPDRTVELVIGGPESAVRAVLALIGERFAAHITSQSESSAPNALPAAGFEIRR